MKKFMTIIETANVHSELSDIISYAKSIGVNIEIETSGNPPYSAGISWIERIPSSVKGNGAIVMKKITQWADSAKIDLSLDAKGGSEELIEYYSLFGFELEQECIDDMEEDEDYAGPWIMYRMAKFYK